MNEILSTITALDQRIMDWILTIRTTHATRVFRFFTDLANWQTVVPAAIIIILLLCFYHTDRSKRRMAATFAATLILGELVSALFKILTHRARPDIALSLAPEVGYSFPSGHALTAVLFYGMISYITELHIKHRSIKILIHIATLLLILMIGLSRIYLGVHWASDVLAGWLVGGIILALIIKVFTRNKNTV